LVIFKIINSHGIGEIKKVIKFFEERGNKKLVKHYKKKLKEKENSKV